MFDRAQAFAAALRRDLERGRRAAQALLKPDCPVSAALTEADKAALNKIAKGGDKGPRALTMRYPRLDKPLSLLAEWPQRVGSRNSNWDTAQASYYAACGYVNLSVISKNSFLS